MCDTDCNFHKLIYTKTRKIDCYIPKFEDVAKMGITEASKSVAKEIIDLLNSDEAGYLSINTFNQIKELIMNEQFDPYSAKSVYKELKRLSSISSCIYQNHAYISELEAWALERHY